MSDTPRTDAMETALLWRTGEVLQSDVEFANFARDLERENAALQKENAALREAFAKTDVLAEYMRSDGRREWQTIECWVYPNDIIVQMDRAAFDAARKEAKP